MPGSSLTTRTLGYAFVEKRTFCLPMNRVPPPVRGNDEPRLVSAEIDIPGDPAQGRKSLSGVMLRTNSAITFAADSRSDRLMTSLGLCI